MDFEQEISIIDVIDSEVVDKISDKGYREEFKPNISFKDLIEWFKTKDIYIRVYYISNKYLFEIYKGNFARTLSIYSYDKGYIGEPIRDSELYQSKITGYNTLAKACNEAFKIAADKYLPYVCCEPDGIWMIKTKQGGVELYIGTLKNKRKIVELSEEDVKYLYNLKYISTKECVRIYPKKINN